MQKEYPRDEQIQVVIVGAGPTGLAAANLLGRYGIRTLLLERRSELSSIPRAVAIDDEGLRIFQAMGLQQEVLEHIELNLPVEYRSGKRILAQVAPQDWPNAYPLISTFHQPTLEAILLRGALRYPSVEICFGATLEKFVQSAEKVMIWFSTSDSALHKRTCNYLLACDGGKSEIRRALNIPLYASSPFLFWQRPHASTQRWLVVDGTEYTTAVDRKIYFFCNPSRPAVTLPTPAHTRRWEFMLFPHESEEEMLRAGRVDALIEETLRYSGLPQQMDPFQIARQAIYSFHRHSARVFSKGRIFLLGDAAHQMPPFGGQGLNSGLRDAHNLCWKLACALQAESDRVQTLLESYHQERAPHAIQMIRFSDQLGQAIMPTSPWIAGLRDLFFQIINIFPGARAGLAEMQIRPQSSYRGPFSLLSRTLIGTLLPQARVLTAGGQTYLLDELLGPGFALLRMYEQAGALKGEIIQPTGAAPGGELQFQKADRLQIEFLDQRQRLSRIQQRAKGKWLLLRPDHYIFDLLDPGKDI